MLLWIGGLLTYVPVAPALLRILRSILFGVVLTVLAAATDTPATKPISDAHMDKFELFMYRERDLKQALEKVQAQQRDLYTEVCKSAGITGTLSEVMTACMVDLQARTVTKRDPPPVASTK